jgi:hypothetical protein
MMRRFESLSRAERTSHAPSEHRARALARLSTRIARRRDILFAQTLSAAIISFIRGAMIRVSRADFWRQISQCGFLAHFDCTVDCDSVEEIGLALDLAETVSSLQQVRFRIVRSVSPEWGGRIRINREDAAAASTAAGAGSKFIVDIALSALVAKNDKPVPADAADAPQALNESIWECLPASVVDGEPIAMRPVLTVMDTGTSALPWESSVVRGINIAGVEAFGSYGSALEKNMGPAVGGSTAQIGAQATLDTLLGRLRDSIMHGTVAGGDANQTARDDARIDAMLLADQISRKVHAGRISCCPDGVSRTAMVATLSSAVLLSREHRLRPEIFQRALAAMRAAGTSRCRAAAAHGSRSAQVLLPAASPLAAPRPQDSRQYCLGGAADSLPLQLRPPDGCASGGGGGIMS